MGYVIREDGAINSSRLSHISKKVLASLRKLNMRIPTIAPC